MFNSRHAIALVVLAAPLPVMGQAARSSAAPSAALITAAKMRADLEFLASDALRGRLTNTPENAIALEWVKARFEWLGLRPKGAAGSYFLPYDLSLGVLGEGNDLAVSRGGAEAHYGLANGFYPHRYSGSGTATGDLVFAHFGIDAPQLGYSDLPGGGRHSRQDPARSRPRTGRDGQYEQVRRRGDVGVF